MKKIIRSRNRHLVNAIQPRRSVPGYRWQGTAEIREAFFQEQDTVAAIHKQGCPGSRVASDIQLEYAEGEISAFDVQVTIG